jgi:methyl acetate hydrolase
MPHKPTRRDLLKTTATVAVTSALALNRSTVARAKEPAEAAAGTLPQVDAVLRAAVSTGDVPGVVAMAAAETGVVYEGAFGSRRIHEGPVMTRDTVFPCRLNGEADNYDGGAATG